MLSKAKEPADLVCRGLRDTDYPEAKKIIATSFSGAIAADPAVLSEYELESWYDPEHLLVAETNGRIVSQMGVRNGLLWCQGIGIPAGLVGTVCTLENWRGMGIGARLIHTSFDLMRRLGLAVSYLHTSEERSGFYRRLGYRQAAMDTSCALLQLDAFGHRSKPTLPPRASLRLGNIRDASQLNIIYDAHCRRTSGNWSRTVPFWRRRLQGKPKLWSAPVSYRVVGQERPEAYIAIRAMDDTGWIGEWACMPGAEHLATTLLYDTLHQWRTQGVQHARVIINRLHPLWSQFVMLNPQEQNSHSVVWVRVQDSKRLLENLLPLLEFRATAAELRLVIRFRDVGKIVEIGEGRVCHIALTVTDLFALFYNGWRLPELMDSGDIEADLDDTEAMALLFPDTGAARADQDAY